MADDQAPRETDRSSVGLGQDNPMAPSDLVNTRVEEAASVLKAMSNETRLKILCALTDGEKSVNELSEMTGMLLPAVSQHLARLRSNKLVESRREAQTIYYRCANGVGRALVNTLCNYYGEEKS